MTNFFIISGACLIGTVAGRLLLDFISFLHTKWKRRNRKITVTFGDVDLSDLTALTSVEFKTKNEVKNDKRK